MIVRLPATRATRTRPICRPRSRSTRPLRPRSPPIATLSLSSTTQVMGNSATDNLFNYTRPHNVSNKLYNKTKMKGLSISKNVISNIYSGSEMINQEHFQKVEIKERLEELHRYVIQLRWFISPSDSNFLKKPIEN